MKKQITALLASVVLLTGCSSGADVAQEIVLPIYGADTVTYEIAEAKYMDISDIQSMGAIIGYPYATYLTYPSNVQVTEWNVVKNREVTAGEVLAVLDSSELDYEINNQQTIVNAAYTASLSGSQTAKLQYQVEQSKLDMLLAEKEKYTLRAPYDGIISYVKRAAVGTDVEQGDVCCAISETDRVAVYMEGNDAKKVRFGQKVTVKIDGIEYPATVAAAPDTAPATATKNSLNRAILDLGEGVLEKISEENALAIAAGWATVIVPTERKNVLAVPDSAVKSSGSDYYVTVVDGEERFKLYVTIGKQLGGYTEIINGISEGDIVMAEGSGMFTEPAEQEQDDRRQGDWNGGEW